MQRGFSLVELLVVIAIIGVMVTVATPSILSQLSHQRLTRTARAISVELNAARLKAITDNKRYRVGFTLNSGSAPDVYSLSVYNTVSAAWEDDATRVSFETEEGINISSPGSNFTVEFSPTGPSLLNGVQGDTSICLQNTHKSGDNMTISVTGTLGRISVAAGC